MFLQAFISGLSTGSVYALVALSIVIIFKASEVVNFGAGEIFMLGAYIGLLFYAYYGLSFLLVVTAFKEIQENREQVFEMIRFNEQEEVGKYLSKLTDVGPAHFLFS